MTKQVLRQEHGSETSRPFKKLHMTELADRPTNGQTRSYVGSLHLHNKENLKIPQIESNKIE